MSKRGFTLIELLIALTVVMLIASVTLPAAARMVASSRMSAGALHIASAFREARWESVASGQSHGLWFRRDGSGWYWLEVRDGNANGLRTADLRSGRDVVTGGPHRLEQRVSSVRVGLPPLSGIPRIPPRSGTLARLADPIRFGRSDIVSFSALGRSSSGTLFLTDGQTGLYAVVLYGRASRVRIWRYEASHNRWSL